MTAEFHRAFEVTVRDTPEWPSPEDSELRLRLIAEEFQELRDAIAEGDMVAVADALGDLVYVTYGSAVTFGIDLDAVLAEIHASNMSKLDAEGRPIHDAGGKVLKSDLYWPPDIARVLEEQRIATRQEAVEPLGVPVRGDGSV